MSILFSDTGVRINLQARSRSNITPKLALQYLRMTIRSLKILEKFTYRKTHYIVFFDNFENLSKNTLLPSIAYTNTPPLPLNIFFWIRSSSNIFGVRDLEEFLKVVFLLTKILDSSRPFADWTTRFFRRKMTFKKLFRNELDGESILIFTV